MKGERTEVSDLTNARPLQWPPGNVLVACVLVYVGAALTFMACLFLVLLYHFNYSVIFAALAVMAAAVPAVVLARLIQRGHQRAHVALTVVGLLYVAGGCVPLHGVPIGLPFALYSLVWVILLWWGAGIVEIDDWSRRLMPGRFSSRTGDV